MSEHKALCFSEQLHTPARVINGRLSARALYLQSLEWYSSKVQKRVLYTNELLTYIRPTQSCRLLYVKGRSNACTLCQSIVHLLNLNSTHTVVEIFEIKVLVVYR